MHESLYHCVRNCGRGNYGQIGGPWIEASNSCISSSRRYFAIFKDVWMRNVSGGGDGEIGGVGGGSLGGFGGEGHQVDMVDNDNYNWYHYHYHYHIIIIWAGLGDRVTRWRVVKNVSLQFLIPLPTIKSNQMCMKGKRKTRFISTSLFLQGNPLEVWWVWWRYIQIEITKMIFKLRESSVIVSSRWRGNCDEGWN